MLDKLFGEGSDNVDDLGGTGQPGINPVKAIAVQNDKRLQEMAAYSCMKGLTVTLTQNIVGNIMSRFVEYKRLIKQGEFSIDELETMVFAKDGIVPTEMIPESVEVPEMLEEITSAKDKLRITGFASE